MNERDFLNKRSQNSSNRDTSPLICFLPIFRHKCFDDGENDFPYCSGMLKKIYLSLGVLCSTYDNQMFWLV